MLHKILFYSIICFTITLSSCEKETPPSNALNKIMPLGASRVAGAKPFYHSYRYMLWKKLVDGAYDFDFIGSAKDKASYPKYEGQSFDKEHEGHGGITSGEIREEIDDWLDETDIPDIVLFSSPGGNDDITEVTYEEVIENIHAIIDAIQATNPNATIIIEQAAPPHSSQLTPEFLEYYNEILNDVVEIAQERTTLTSQVLTVDMATDFQDDYLADDVHYNEDGGEFIAQKYYDVLVDILKQ